MGIRLHVAVVIGLVLLLGSSCITSSNADHRSSSTSVKDGYARYVNEEYEFSVDYPQDWLLEEVSPNEVGIRPKAIKYNQIQIGVYDAKPLIGEVEEPMIGMLHETSLSQYFESMGAYDLEILVNEPKPGIWDWELKFSVVHEGTSLHGGQLIRERSDKGDKCLTYSLFYMYAKEWPEGNKVINSFTFTQ